MVIFFIEFSLGIFSENAAIRYSVTCFSMSDLMVLFIDARGWSLIQGIRSRDGFARMTNQKQPRLYFSQSKLNQHSK